MKNVTPFPVAAPIAPEGVIVLRCPHEIHFDAAPLRVLFAQKEPHVAEEILCRMLEDIAMRLDHLQRGLVTRDFEPMAKAARRIALVAKQIGLSEVVVAAGHVQCCVRQNDGIALEATIARLERGFDIAVNEVWDFRGL